MFPDCCNVYARGPVGENVLHTAMLLNTPSTLAIARYLVKLYGPTLVNCPFTVRLGDKMGEGGGCCRQGQRCGRGNWRGVGPAVV
jgi:hypothetical protein